MKPLLIIAGIVALIALGLNLGGCSYRNVNDIKEHAPEVWDRLGLEIVGYEGYQIGECPECPGGKVWYTVQRKGDPRIRYSGFISKWGDEYHIYSLKAVDAISPK